MKEQAIRLAKRFARAFVAGGVAAVATFLATGTQMSDFKDFDVFAVPLTMAFVTGGLMAIDKLLRDAPAVQ